jgi:hypothetical protein
MWSYGCTLFHVRTTPFFGFVLWRFWNNRNLGCGVLDG